MSQGSLSEANARMLDVIRELSERIGPRPGGSAAARQAAEYLGEHLDGFGLETEFQPFTFMGWEYDREPILELVSPHQESIECAPMAYALATDDPLDGVVWHDGEVAVVPEFFEFTRLAVGEDGQRRGAIYIPPVDAPPFPLPKMGSSARFGEPGLYVSRRDGLRLLSWIDQGAEVRIRIETFGHHVPDLQDVNVVGRLAGQRPERVVISSHFDSAWRSPGAMDNGSGCAAMVEVARRMVERGVRHTFEFVSFGAEEWGILGSEYFVLEAEHRGEIDLYKGVVNCDPLAAGDELSVWVGPDSLRGIANEVIEDLGLRSDFKVTFADPQGWCGGGSDYRPFWERGIPACYPMLLPFPEQYHQPSDTVDGVDADALRAVVDVIDGVACGLDRQEQSS